MVNAQNAEAGCIGVNIAKLNRKKRAVTRRANHQRMGTGDEGQGAGNELGVIRATTASKRARLAKVRESSGRVKGKSCRSAQTHSPTTPKGTPNANAKPNNAVHATATGVDNGNRCNFSPPSRDATFRAVHHSLLAIRYSPFATRRNKGCALARGRTVFGQRWSDGASTSHNRDEPNGCGQCPGL